MVRICISLNDDCREKKKTREEEAKLEKKSENRLFVHRNRAAENLSEKSSENTVRREKGEAPFKFLLSSVSCLMSCLSSLLDIQEVSTNLPQNAHFRPQLAIFLLLKQDRARK